MAVLALTMFMGAGAPAHASSDVYVLEDDTPIVSKPGIGGRILARVDAGFALTVLDRDGDWYRVASPRLSGDSLWVPAARVGDRRSGAAGVLNSPDTSLADTKPTFFRLEISGSSDFRVRAKCRIEDLREDESRRDGSRTAVDDVPVTVELDGPAVDCNVRMFPHTGETAEMNVVLRKVDGTIVANATSFQRRDLIRVRSDGPWGSAGGFIERLRFLGSSESSATGQPSVPPLDNPVPPLGNPVPPLLPTSPR